MIRNFDPAEPSQTPKRQNTGCCGPQVRRPLEGNAAVEQFEPSTRGVREHMSLTSDSESLGTPDLANAATALLTISGMHCGSCAALIEETLTESPGVTAATVDLTTALAEVTFDPSATAVEALCAAVIREGYGAVPQGGPES